MNMTVVLPDGTVVSAHRELADVTCNHRPDLQWVENDPSGHVHRWMRQLADGTFIPAYDQPYNPQSRYSVPSLIMVEDAPASDEYPAITHMECFQCGVRIEPRYVADETVQTIAGLLHYTINGEQATRSQVKAALARNGYKSEL